MTAGRLSALLAAVGLPAAGAAQAVPRLERIEVISSIWFQARQNHVHWDRVVADWDSAYRAMIEAADRGGSDVAFHDQLSRFAALLNSGDAQVTPPSGIQRRLGRPPIRLRLVEGRPIVVQVQPTAEMRIAGVVPGDEITEVRAMPVNRWLRDSVLPTIAASSEDAREAAAVEEMLTGERNTAIQITLRGPDGTPRGASLTRSVAAENRLVPAELRDGIAVRDSAGVRVIALGALDRERVLRELAQALRRDPTPTGIVLDLRDTEGGNRDVALQLVSLLFAGPVEAPRIRHRIYWPLRAAEAWTWHVTAPDTVTPAAGVYGGPIVLVTSPRTAGAGELFAVIVRLTRRGTIVGATTAGASAPTVSLELPGGWLLAIPVGIEVAADGSEVAALGVEPDERARQTIDDLRAGHDAALERAFLLLSAAEPARP